MVGGWPPMDASGLEHWGAGGAGARQATSRSPVQDGPCGGQAVRGVGWGARVGAGAGVRGLRPGPLAGGGEAGCPLGAAQPEEPGEQGAGRGERLVPPASSALVAVATDGGLAGERRGRALYEAGFGDQRGSFRAAVGARLSRRPNLVSRVARVPRGRRSPHWSSSLTPAHRGVLSPASPAFVLAPGSEPPPGHPRA